MRRFKMTQDRKEYKLHLLRSQVNNPKANYRKYLVNLYNYYVNECKKNNANWCVSNLQDMYKIITVGCHKPSVSFTACKGYIKELHELGYIQDKYVDGVWKSYVIKELDF